MEMALGARTQHEKKHGDRQAVHRVKIHLLVQKKRGHHPARGNSVHGVPGVGNRHAVADAGGGHLFTGQQLLEQVCTNHPGRDFVTELKQGKPSAQILDAERKHGAGLIVMGTHGRGGLEELFLGSVAARVVRDKSHLREILARLDAAEVESVFVPGGDAPEPAGGVCNYN